MPAENIKSLENFIRFCSVRNKVINKNIANVETKNYKREEVTFKDMLEGNISSSLRTTNGKHIGRNIADGVPEDFQIVEDKSEEAVSGVNNVNIDSEMADLADNSLKFKFAAKKIGSYYRDLQSVIKSRGNG
jgi:flagellar basal-body rod protein FlgB